MVIFFSFGMRANNRYIRLLGFFAKSAELLKSVSEKRD